MLWENDRDGEIFVFHSIWNGRVRDPKVRTGRAPMSVIRPPAERLEIHRLRTGESRDWPGIQHTGILV